MELKEINRLLNKEKGKGKIFSLSENTDDQQNNLAGLCFQKRIVLSKKMAYQTLRGEQKGLGVGSMN